MIEVKYDNADERSGGQWYEIGPAVIRFPYNASSEVCEQAKRDAELIAEAFNVREETGLTPRQLVEQRAKMIVALEAVDNTDFGCGCCAFDNTGDNAREMTSAILAEIKPRTP